MDSVLGDCTLWVGHTTSVMGTTTLEECMNEDRNSRQMAGLQAPQAGHHTHG